MPIRVNCPQCQAAYSCPDEHRGKKLRCTRCQHVFAVPAAPQPEPPSKGNSPTALSAQRQSARPTPEEPPLVEAASPPSRKRTVLPLVLVLVGVGFFLCCGVGVGAPALLFLMWREPSSASMNQPQAAVREVQAQVNAVKGAGDKQAEAEPDKPVPPPAPEPKNVPEPRPATTTKPEPKNPLPADPPKNEPAAGEVEKVPVKAVAGKLFRWQVPLDKPGLKVQMGSGPPGMGTNGTEVVWMVDKNAAGMQEFALKVLEGRKVVATKRYQVEVGADVAAEAILKDQSSLPEKATIGKPFTFRFPNPDGSIKYELIPQLQQQYPGLKLAADGTLTWVPPPGTQGHFRLMVMVNGKLQTYYLEFEEGAAGTVLKDQGPLPEKATIGKPFTYRFPNPDGSIKYELLPQLQQKYPGLTLAADGTLTWTPPPGTPARVQLMVMVGTRHQTFYLEMQEDTATTLPLPSPAGWVMLRDGVTLIAALADKAQLVYIDTLTPKEMKRQDVGFKPAALAAQGDLLFAVTQGTGIVHVIDLKTGEEKKEVKVSDSPIRTLVCHPEQGLVWASTTKLQLVGFDPASGKVSETRAQGMFLAIDPIKGDALYAGIQGRIEDVVVVKDLGGGRFAMHSGLSGDRATLLKYTIQGTNLIPAGGNNNAAQNGRALAVSGDGKKVGIPGGGGYRPPPGGAGVPGSKGYGIALFSTDDAKTVVGEVECGSYPSNLAFHPVLDLGVAEQKVLESDLHVFNSKSLVEIDKIHFASGEGPPLEQKADLLTFGGKGTKVLFHDTRPNGSFLRLLPLKLSDKDREALAKAYGQ